MIKLTKEVYDQSSVRKGDLIQLDFRLKQLITLRNLSDFVKVDRIRDLVANQNNLRTMEVILTQCTNLKVLELALNYIKEIENFQGLSVLEVLNLSTNKLTRVPDLSELKQLKKLDLSMNFIVQFDDMSLPNLDTLKLPGNQLTFLPSLKGFPRLREFDIARNQITSVTRIVSEGGLQYLERLKGSFNQLSGEYLDEFCFVLQNLPNLLEVDFKGNDMSLVKDYQLKILKAKKLRVLDNMMLSDTVIQNMINLNKNKQYEILIQDTKEEYFKWMEERERVRKDVKKNLLEQRLKVDELFDEKREETIKEMNDFMEFIKELERKKRNGTNIDMDLKSFQEWKRKILESEQMRLQSLQLIQQQQTRNRDHLLNNQIGTRNIMQKLFDIALNEPDIWRDIKRQEIAQVQANQMNMDEDEQDEIEKARQQDQPEQFNQVAAQMRQGLRNRSQVGSQRSQRSVNESIRSRKG